MLFIKKYLILQCILKINIFTDGKFIHNMSKIFITSRMKLVFIGNDYFTFELLMS